MTFDPRLYLVFDHDYVKENLRRPEREVLEELLRGGVRLLQFRMKGSDNDYVTWVKGLSDLPRRYHIPFLINDRISVAQETQADGVHLGQSDESPFLARQILGPKALVGLTIENMEELLRHCDDTGIDYLALSALFPTDSKKDVQAHWGLDGLSKARAQTDRPLIVIGGIHEDQLGEIIDRGADGVAVISGLLHPPRQEFHPLPYQSRAARWMNPWRQLESRLSDEWQPQIFRSATVTSRHRLRWVPAKALTIAGSDSGGGAGIQADLKSFAASQVYGLSVITAITAQNTKGVQAVFDLPLNIIEQQIHSVLGDLRPQAIKIGMLSRPEVIELIAEILQSVPHLPLVLDPVMVAKGGHALIQPEAIQSLLKKLLPRVTLLTPNQPEAEAFLKLLPGVSQIPFSDRVQGGQALQKLGPQAVLMKGGHVPSADGIVEDLLITSTSTLRFSNPWQNTQNTHGTGCSLSSFIAAEMAKGRPLTEAVTIAQSRLHQSLRAGQVFTYGEGHGPIHHFANFHIATEK